MPAERRVLLARPHAFIVDEMGPFLVEAGFTPVRIASLDELAAELGRPLCGAVVSTAISSSVAADAATVFRLVRERVPRLPVIFAGMADVDTMTSVATRAVKPVVASPTIADPQGYRAAGDRTSAFLVLRKDDLVSAAARAATLRAVRLHFA